MTTPRPVNHNPLNYHFPITAVVSILHRISGVVLFLSIPLLILVYHGANGSPDDFYRLLALMQTVGGKLLTWCVLSVVGCHVLAGLRHLSMDMGFAESLSAATITSWLVVSLEVILVILVGVWLW